MLKRYRRYFAVLAFALLATPLVVGLIRPDSPELILKEGRMLASTPQAPLSWDALIGVSGRGRRLAQGSFRPPADDDPHPTRPVPPRALRQREGPHRPRRPDVLSRPGHGASERRARSARPEGGRCGRHAGRDARRARPARRKPAGGGGAQFLDNLPGRPSALGAKAGDGKPSTISFSPILRRAESRRST